MGDRNSTPNRSRAELFHTEGLDITKLSPVMDALAMGFDKQLVMEAFECLMGDDGDARCIESINITHLLDRIFELQEETNAAKEAAEETVLQEIINEGGATGGATGGVEDINTEHESNFERTIVDMDEGLLLEMTKQLKDTLTCKICMTKSACIILQPCGHLCSCPVCVKKLTKCPMCRIRVGSSLFLDLM